MNREIISAIDGKPIQITDSVKFVRLPTFRENQIYSHIRSVIEMEDGSFHYTIHPQKFVEKILGVG